MASIRVSESLAIVTIVCDRLRFLGVHWTELAAISSVFHRMLYVNQMNVDSLLLSIVCCSVGGYAMCRREHVALHACVSQSGGSGRAWKPKFRTV